ncbi:DUF3885 domain-containing protein [Terribacillus saccharophilus]|uniref:DUF3885 domain-containing protein n=1 Tax=Terribacillus saccharophilus TaxID=361277 RepID=UPI003981B7FA
MHVKDYLKKSFPGLELVPSIYGQWHTGIHIELGEDLSPSLDDYELNMDYFHLVYQQTLTIFNTLFDAEDELYLAANLYKVKNAKAAKTQIFNHYVRNKKLLYKIQGQTHPYPFDTSEEEQGLFEYLQLSLLCKSTDIRIPALLKAACNEDFPSLKPRFKKNVGYPDVFFINKSKDIIFFIYDDRGCEIIAKESAALDKLSSQLTAFTYDKKIAES